MVYRHALMHRDGNTRYANYPGEQQMKDYLADTGYEGVTDEGWIV